MDESTTEAPFHAMSDEEPTTDDFFDTTAEPRQYNLDSERFIFDGDEEDVVISPSSLMQAYSGSTNEPLLPGYHISGGFQLNYDDDWSDDHPLALPIARLERQYTAHELSGLNYLNLCTFVFNATISILFGSGFFHWLPSPWTVTTLPAYETLLTPSQWAGDYLWMPGKFSCFKNPHLVAIGSLIDPSFFSATNGRRLCNCSALTFCSSSN